jgi:hypothetical protein
MLPRRDPGNQGIRCEDFVAYGPTNPTRPSPAPLPSPNSTRVAAMRP